MSYERQLVTRLHAYVPGEQPQGGKVVKLNTNENPYPPAEAVMQAVHAVPAEMLRRYPSPTAEPFRRAAAKLHGVAPEQVIATNGGDELLRLALTAFVEPGTPIGTAEPSYSLYPVLADIHGALVQRAELEEDWSLPPDFAQTMNDSGANLVLLVNPHAPSGRLSTAADLADIARTLNGVLLIDEAYVDFVDPARAHDTLALLEKFDNVLILRTLSKGYSLAGLRFGYGIGSAALIRALHKVRDSYNLDAIAQAAATVALEHRDVAARSWAAVRAERERLATALIGLGMSVPASETNFLLAQNSGGRAARGVYEGLKERGILVRWFDQPRLRDRLRITVGTPEQNDALLRALQELLPGG